MGWLIGTTSPKMISATFVKPLFLFSTALHLAEHAVCLHENQNEIPLSLSFWQQLFLPLLLLYTEAEDGYIEVQGGSLLERHSCAKTNKVWGVLKVLGLVRG